MSQITNVKFFSSTSLIPTIKNVEKTSKNNEIKSFFKFDTPLENTIKDVFVKQDKAGNLINKCSEIFY